MAKCPAPLAGRAGHQGVACVAAVDPSALVTGGRGRGPDYSLEFNPHPIYSDMPPRHDGSPVPRFNLLILTFLTERDRIARREAIRKSIVGRTGCPLIKTNAFFVCSLFLTI